MPTENAESLLGICRVPGRAALGRPARGLLNAGRLGPSAEGGEEEKAEEKARFKQMAI